jgi:subtilisin-like proprotein convertase family protein
MSRENYMNKIILLLPVLAVLVISNSAMLQDKSNEDPRWVQDPSTRVRVLGDYSSLPQVDNYVHPNKETRVLETPAGNVVLLPNFRPFPSPATQSEVEACRHPGNQNMLFIAWNSFQSPSTFFGTGWATSSNAGLNWTGNVQTVPNFGDPGPWIWGPTGTFAGRFGISFITSSFAMGASFSTNNGSTWAPAVTFAGSSNADKNFSATDDQPSSPFFGRAYTVWTAFSLSSRIVISFTTDGGATWSPTSPVSPVPSGGHHNQGCDVKVGPGGVVHVIWAHCTTNGQNSTEDNLGYARSTDGGVTWAFSSNNVADMNGIRTSNLMNGIRANGFPRLDIDKTGGARNGWLYVVAGEKNFAPALDNSDIVLMRSTNNGVNWTRTRVNQDAAGKLNWFGAVRVDEQGGLNIVYYDQRNVSSTQAEVFVSRSLDGGNTFTDIQASDHSFTPAPISGLATGYQGDYIGITSGNGKLWPVWMDNSSGIYQVWTVEMTIGAPLAHDILTGPFLSLPGLFVANNPHNIRTRVTNLGASNETGIPIRFFINSVLTNTTNINLNSGASDSVTNVWTPTSPGTYTLTYAAGLSTDLNRANDTIRTTVNVQPSTPVPVTSSFCRNGLNLPILDLQTTRDSIVVSVPNAISVLDVNVKVDTVIHTYDGDLVISILHAGTTVDLSNRRGGSGNNFIGTIFNDSAALPISAGSPPFTGSFRPETPLAAFNGSSPNGSWTLTIADEANADTGFLRAWCITINYLSLVGNIETVNIPNFYSLTQNYPNPFNPSTKITYTLPKSGNVEMKVYDLLGREVAVLVNEMKQPGVYTIDFNAAENLASGVYFYRIEIGDAKGVSFTNVKKMLLVK